MSKLGGYQIIDFGGFDLNTVTTDPTDVNVKTSIGGISSGKRVVLSGLTIDGRQLNDLTADLNHISDGEFQTSFLDYKLHISNGVCEISKEESDECYTEYITKHAEIDSGNYYFTIDESTHNRVIDNIRKLVTDKKGVETVFIAEIRSVGSVCFRLSSMIDTGVIYRGVKDILSSTGALSSSSKYYFFLKNRPSTGDTITIYEET